MASPRPEAPLAALLGKGARYSGDLSFDGRVRLDGYFKGRIHTEDVLEVGESGVVEGQVDAATLIVAGKVTGAIKVTELLTLTRTASVSGEIDAARMQVDPGARIDAKVKCG